MTKHSSLLFKARSSSVAQARLKLQIPLSPLHQCRNYKYAPPKPLLLLVLKVGVFLRIHKYLNDQGPQVCLKKAGSIQHKAHSLRQERRGLLSIRLPALCFGDGKLRNGKVTNVYECCTIYLV